MSKRKKHAPTFKVKVALAALSGGKTLAEPSAESGVHQTLIHKWVKRLKESAAGIFAGEIKTEEARADGSTFTIGSGLTAAWEACLRTLATNKGL